jgi:hypothetical protein
VSLPVSIAIPYFERAECLDMGLAALHRYYGDADGFEINLVDDGSIHEPALPVVEKYRAIGFNIRHEYLGPPKSYGLTPTVPMSIAVSMASNDVIVMTNPEALHRGPILYHMLASLREVGPMGVISAAAFCPADGRWHNHGKLEAHGFHHCNMLHRSLFGKVGGMAQVYRWQTFAYDDTDFVQRLLAAGAKYVFRDDLVIEHLRNHRHIDWKYTVDGYALFNSIWPEATRRFPT